MTVSAATRVEPILLAVLANRMETIVREMTNTLFRTARSSVINEARDFSCSIVTAGDELLAAAEGLQIHVLGGGLQTPSLRELHSDMRPGDGFLHNDPYRGNTHTADFTILVPVFVAGEHIFTACAKAHQADCGNASPSTYMPFAADVYEEGGLTFPCVLVQRDYRDVEDVVRMCRARIRVPEMWYGDHLAAVGAARIGERRLLELVERYGLPLIKAFVSQWLDYAEERMATAVASLPTARLHGMSIHDALSPDTDPIEVNVAVDVDPGGGRIVVDLRDNPPTLPNGLNLSECCARAGACIGVFNCVDPTIPHNAGSFRRIDVLLAEDCAIGGPRFPHSSSMATTNLVNRVIDSVQAAFAQLGSDFGLAEGAGAMGAGFAVVSGEDPRFGRPYVNQMIAGNNGGPGAPGTDGWITYAMPDCAKTPYVDSVEVLEQKYPLHFRELRLLADSGGPGRWRGGPASSVVYGPRLQKMRAFYFADYAVHAAQGVRGGLPGAAARVFKVEADGREIEVPPIGDVTLEPGEAVRAVEAGGGGYGDPLLRDPDAVLEDVLEGWVSPAAALDVYGVVLKGSAKDGSLMVDKDATDTRRGSGSESRTTGGSG